MSSMFMGMRLRGIELEQVEELVTSLDDHFKGEAPLARMKPEERFALKTQAKVWVELPWGLKAILGILKAADLDPTDDPDALDALEWLNEEITEKIQATCTEEDMEAFGAKLQEFSGVFQSLDEESGSDS